jgi:hypothetical protein
VAKANWVYELPFGRGRWIGSNASGWVDRVIGGWEFDGIVRIQSGRLLDFGNVRLVGMSVKDLQKAVKLQEFATTGISATAPTNIYLLPKDIMENTIRAFSTLATSPTGYGSLGAPSGRYIAPANGPDCIETIAGGYGDCGLRTVVVTGPMYSRWDLSAVKRTRLVGHTTFEFRADLLNAFNHPELHAGDLDVDQRRQLPHHGRSGKLEPHHPARGAVFLLVFVRGASPLGLPDTRSRAPLRRRAPIAWLARCARSRGGISAGRVAAATCPVPGHPTPRIWFIQKAVLDAGDPMGVIFATRGIVRPSTVVGGGSVDGNS